METNSGGHHLERKTSQNSSRSVQSGTVRNKGRRLNSSASTTPAPTPSDKSLTSFPSLSPASSPVTSRHNMLDSLNIVPTRYSPPLSAPQRTASPPSLTDLTTASPSLKARGSLFDDAPLSGHYVPGTIHLASDDHIERLVARNGAVAFIRRLAQDLAQRDTQMVVLRRKAEERERLLKKMLLECQVTNLDIETRLRGLDSPSSGQQGSKKGDRRTSDSGKSVDSSIGEMMSQAMTDTVGAEGTDGEDGYLGLGSADGLDRDATIRAGKLFSSPDAETQSIESTGNADKKPKGTMRGWKDYLWGGTAKRNVSGASSIASDSNDDMDRALRARTVSGAGPHRKSLQSDLFDPPQHLHNGHASRSSSLQTPSLQVGGDNSDAHSQKSSVSVASWALKLVAGTSQTSRDGDGQRVLRGRTAALANGTRQDPETASITSTKTSASTVAVASKSGIDVPATHGSRRPALSISSGTAQTAINRSHSSGPVEMDTILPPDTRPPTLLQTYNDYHPTEFLTDRFGFIYDQRRRRQQKEAADRAQKIKNGGSRTEMLPGAVDGESLASDDGEEDLPMLQGTTSRPETPASAEDQGKTTKKWQDFLKLATTPTELLSHTPSPAALAVPEQDNNAPSKSPQIIIESSGPHPSAIVTPLPLASTVVSDHATLAKPSRSGTSTPASGSKDQTEPVKLLLEQLTDLHDSLQRDKTVRWNEFLRKVRAERRREGQAAAAAALEGRTIRGFMPEASFADGEIIGVAGLGNKGKFGRAKWKEFKSLVLGGIPVVHRAKIWAECSGASALRVPGYYDDLVNNGTDDPSVVAQISMDINRTLTDNIFFRKGPGVIKLEEVLLAYARRNPEVGYCQGMNMIAASLLLIMPTAEDAFWVLTSMIENILPPNYYDHSLLGSRADQQVLRQYVSEILPKLSSHLDDLGIELEALTFQWFLSVFTDCLSAEALFRVWDVVLCTNDGSTFLFQLALALLKLNEKQLLRCSTPAGVYSYINHHMTNHAISIDGLIQASDALKKVVRRNEIEERRKRAVEMEMEVMRARNEIRMAARDKRQKPQETQQSENLNGTDKDKPDKGGDGSPESEGELQLQQPITSSEEETARNTKENLAPET